MDRQVVLLMDRFKLIYCIVTYHTRVPDVMDAAKTTIKPMKANAGQR